MSASSMKTIKNRIKSISSTMQITKAMELVAASKMRKASAGCLITREFIEFLKGVRQMNMKMCATSDRVDGNAGCRGGIYQ